MNKYKWRPNKQQKKEFKIKMSNPEYALEYYKRKDEAKKKRRATSSFSYDNAGGMYVATKAQHDFCLGNSDLFVTFEEQRAMNEVLYSFSSQTKVHHDNIHIVNKKIRASLCQ